MIDKISFTRLTRDITDGLIVLDLRGEVVFANKIVNKMLETEKINPGTSYADFMMANQNPHNDLFHQFLIDAVYDKKHAHSGELVYHLTNGEKKIFNVTTSFLFGEDGKTQEGVIIQISDITEVATLRKKSYDSARVFVVHLSCLSLWVFVCAIWEYLGRPISDEILTIIIEFYGLGMFYYLLNYTSITLDDMGLNTKNISRYLLIDTAFALCCLGILIATKVFLIKYTGEDAPIFEFRNFNWACYIYPITVVLQEFLTRGVVQESIRRIIPGKYSSTVAIITSSLFFAALHIHKGILFMFGAFVLLSVFGIIYKKQGTIWGLCIIHLVSGWALTLLFG